MKNKGFTLAELIGVLVILALISMIAVPAISSSIKQYKSKVCEVQLENITEAGKSWAANNLEQLPETNEDDPRDVYLSTLIQYGFIDEDVKNPKTKEPFEAGLVVRIQKYNGNFTYKLYDVGDVNNESDDTLITISDYCD
ncbi:MAG: type II secretion system protein [Bacilli bacterium]|nr:type II secretion system protein [Bacilli bacterium]